MRFWKGWCGSKGIEIDRSANIKASEALTIPTVTARNSFRIVKVGLSEYCTASQKIISAVPPPLFRGEARVLAICYILRNRQSVHLKARVMVRCEG